MCIRSRGKEGCPEDIGNKKLFEEGKYLKVVRCIMQAGQKDLRGYY